MKRFAAFSDSEIEEKRANAIPKNTKKSENVSERLFAAFLQENGNLNMHDITNEELDSLLTKFWFSARTQKGELYRVSTLENWKHSLNRMFKRNGRVDILKSEDLRKSQDAFKDATRELKSQGMGYVEHYPEIKLRDLRQLYDSQYMNPDFSPMSLQNKVQFDLRFYFCRRGNENIYDMTKTTFKIVKDVDTGIRFVLRKEDELTKNHSETDGEVISGVMPELGSNLKMCPVRSFELYLSKLNVDCPFLWQRANTQKGNCWYYNKRVGINTLASYLSKLSKACNLSSIYTNHSIRSTGTTFLGRNQFSSKQIMSVTGHKSVQSLSIYQKVSTNEKIVMGMSMNYFLSGVETPEETCSSHSASTNQTPQMQSNVCVPPPTLSSVVVPQNHESSAISPLSVDANDFDLMEYLDNIDDGQITLSQCESEDGNVIKSIGISKKNMTSSMPVFHNCKINTINININKC